MNTDANKTVTLTVTGMKCPKCEARIERLVGELDAVESVKADREQNLVTVKTYSDDNAKTVLEITRIITECGFTVGD